MGMVSLGKTKLQVSEIIQGTWVMGKDYWGGAEDRESAEAIQCALEHGINTFDTAYIYGKGHAEELLGEALRGVRDKCVIITKLWKTDMARERDAARAGRGHAAAADGLYRCLLHPLSFGNRADRRNHDRAYASEG